MLIACVLRAVFSVYTPFKSLQERVLRWFFSLTPTCILSIDYVPDDNHAVYRVFDTSHDWFSNRLGNLQGYLGICYWDARKGTNGYLALHSFHIQKALRGGFSTDFGFGVYSQEGFLRLLEGYTRSKQDRKILDITLQDTPIYREIKHLLPSLAIHNNLTPKALYLLCYPNKIWKGNEKEKEEDIVLTYVDDNLEEHVVKNDTFV